MDTGGAFLQVVLALMATLGLVLLLAYLAKRFTGIGGRANSSIKVISVTQLGARERLVLVQAGDKQLLLGVAQQQISTLHSFDEPIAEISNEEQTDFPSTLKNWMQR